MTDTSKILRYYEHFAEWQRLEAAEGRLEFELSMRHLESQLEPGSRILDLGGGPGRYTIALAEKGHQVFLAELSPVLVDIAKQRIASSGFQDQVLGIEVMSALDLGAFDNESFDAIVCFGPFYHLTKKDEQIQSATEIHRILKTDGQLFTAYIPRWTGLSNMISRAASTSGQVTVASFSRTLETGVFENPSDRGFQEAYFFTTDVITGLFESVGFTTVDTVAVQGLGAGKEEDLYKIRDKDRELFETILAAIQENARDKAVLEFGGHCIYTGIKRSA